MSTTPSGNHESPKSKIPKRKKARSNTPLSCKIEYYIETNSACFSGQSAFFTDDQVNWLFVSADRIAPGGIGDASGSPAKVRGNLMAGKLALMHSSAPLGSDRMIRLSSPQRWNLKQVLNKGIEINCTKPALVGGLFVCRKLQT
jgi:hypothetical protein